MVVLGRNRCLEGGQPVNGWCRRAGAQQHVLALQQRKRRQSQPPPCGTKGWPGPCRRCHPPPPPPQATLRRASATARGAACTPMAASMRVGQRWRAPRTLRMPSSVLHCRLLLPHRLPVGASCAVQQGHMMQSPIRANAGEWQHDMRHGQGTCLFANGDKYKGGRPAACCVLHSVLARGGMLVLPGLHGLLPAAERWCRPRAAHCCVAVALTGAVSPPPPFPLQASGTRTSGTARACASLQTAASSGVSSLVGWAGGARLSDACGSGLSWRQLPPRCMHASASHPLTPATVPGLLAYPRVRTCPLMPPPLQANGRMMAGCSRARTRPTAAWRGRA